MHVLVTQCVVEQAQSDALNDMCANRLRDTSTGCPFPSVPQRLAYWRAYEREIDDCMDVICAATPY